MPERIPQSVAKRVVFRALLASGGTPATGKTVAVTISKNGGAFGNPAAGATNATEISSGFYYFDLGTSDTGTLGPLAWRGAEGTISDVGDVFEVTNPNNGGLAALPDTAVTTNGSLLTAGTGTAQISASAGVVSANAVQISGDSVAADNAESFFDGTGYAGTNNVIPTVTTLTGHTPQTGDAYARLGAPAGASVSADIAAAKVVVDAIKVKTDYLPSATAGASGGVMIAGSNAASTFASLTVTGQLVIQDGIAVTVSTSNRSAISATGNGTGHGLIAIGGSGVGGSGIVGNSQSTTGNGISAFATTGNGFRAASIGGNGHGAFFSGNGSGIGLRVDGGATANGVQVNGGATSGDAVVFTGTAGNARGMLIQGQGSNDGLEITGGATGIGVDINGGSSSGAGMTIDSTGSAAAVVITGATDGVTIEGNAGHGLSVTGYSGNGIYAVGAFSYNGITAQGGVAGHGMLFAGGAGGMGAHFLGADGGAGAQFSGEGAGNALSLVGGSTGRGLNVTGGSTSGDAAVFTAQGGNSRGMLIQGQGSNDGLEIAGGATGIGVDINGGSSSGVGMTIDSTSGDALQITAGGGNGDGVQIAGNGSGHGIRVTGGATGNGILATGGATSGHGAAFDAVNSGYFGVAIDGVALDAAQIAAIAAAEASILSAVGDVPTNSELATALASADDAVLAAISSTEATILNAIAAQSGDTSDDAIIAAINSAESTIIAAIGLVSGGGGDTSDDAIIAAIAAAEASILSAVGDVPTNSELATALASADDAVLAAISGLSIPSVGAIATAVLTTPMTESYRANGAAPTLSQTQFELLAHHGEAANAGTTKTLRGIDHSTAVMTFAYDNADNPTSVTRTS